MSEGLTDHPLRIINNLICLLTIKSQGTNRHDLFFISGSVNKDGSTYLPLDPILNFNCECNVSHDFKVLIEVENTFYSVLTL